MNRLIVILFLFFETVLAFGKSTYTTVDIWEGVDGVRDVKMLCYRPMSENNTGAAVIIFPGGSYHHLGRNHEGRMVAEWFVEHGISAFVVYYRTAGRGYHQPAMFEDFQRSIQIVRENAYSYGIDINRVGAIGFSAGGHLVGMGAISANKNYLRHLGLKSEVSLKPDWAVLIYPVVSMQDDLAHIRSRKNLLGRGVSQETKDKFSLEMNVSEDMSPLFLLAAKDDDVVDYQNSVVLDMALMQKDVPHTFLLLESGGHGFGMKESEFAIVSHWREKLFDWLTEIKIIK